MGANGSIAVDRPSPKLLPQQTTMNSESSTCPIDHQAREAWLRQARPTTQVSPYQSSRDPQASGSALINKDEVSAKSTLDLGTAREVSSIPRASAPADDKRPPNHEIESSKDSSTGNWIYPSERMFFDAMKRKNYEPYAHDMRNIVPIHNAVNERAWQEILAWESEYKSCGCSGPKLSSFSGQATALTPRARFNTLLGYTAPFDRHDWVVDRCGKRIDYVIDFYAGKDEGISDKRLNFYLDVRPKLNTWEGCRMRMAKLLR